VVVISVYAFSRMSGIIELWIDFGVGKNRKMVPIHEINGKLSREVVSNMPFFHAFTGCDTVSSFCGIGKRTAWKTWQAYTDVNVAFAQLSMATSGTVTDEIMQCIERYTVLLYDRTSACSGVNDCRRILYTRKNRAIENIPPTSDALLQHTKRAALQAHIWIACLSSFGPVLDPLQWGWTTASDGSYQPLWSTIPDVSLHCTELVKCSCKNKCKNCKCKKSQLRCTKLCSCDGTCDSPASQIGNDEHEIEQLLSANEPEEQLYDIPCHDIEGDMEADNMLDIFFNESEF
jgi:hypothetical protein